MFTQKSFEIFKIEGLEPRMTEIRSEIQPVFSEIGQKLLTELSVKFQIKNFTFTSLNIAEEQQMRLKILGQQFPQKSVVIKWKPIFN